MATIDPTRWHRKPLHTYRKVCPICGLAGHLNGLHRAARESEGKNIAFYIRESDGRARPVMRLGVNATVRKPNGPSPRISEAIGQAAGLLATGKTLEETAKLLGVPSHRIIDWRKRHTGLWGATYDKACANVRIAIRAQAGTDAVLDDPIAYIQRATACDRWTEKRGETLFESAGKLTLSIFYANHFRANCLADAKPATIVLYEHALRRWRLVAGDPALSAITPEILSRFRDFLSRLRGKLAVSKMSANTVRKDIKIVQTILAKAGQPGHRNRDALGLLDKVPWIRPPRLILREPRFVSPELIDQVYRGACLAEAPRCHGVKPGAWWRALLVTAYNTGLRLGALLALRVEDVTWDDSLLRVSADHAKTSRGQLLPLNEITIKHLRAIRTSRDLLFSWPHHRRWFHRSFHALQNKAALPERLHFGLHDLRRSAASLLWEHSPAAAQLMLGHASSQTTSGHYVNGRAMLAKAAAGLPQPAAFTEGGVA